MLSFLILKHAHLKSCSDFDFNLSGKQHSVHN